MKVLTGRAETRATSLKVLALLLLAGAVAMSAVIGYRWSSQTRERESQAFAIRATAIGSAVVAEIKRLDDLTVGARAKIASARVVTNADFQRWYEDVDARHRYSGALGFGYLELVRPAQVPEFIAAVRADPIPGIRFHEPFEISPSGRRPSYCLMRLGVAGWINRLALGGYGLDVCAVPGLAVLQESSDSGEFAALVVTVGRGQHALLVAAPVYRAGIVPSTLSERRLQTRGWVMGAFDIDAVLGTTVPSGTKIGLSVERVDATSSGAGSHAQPANVSRIATIGPTLSGSSVLSQRFSVEADGHWLVTVSGVANYGALSPAVQGVLIAVICTLVALLTFVLGYVLVKGRARALHMVHEKTDQLRHQALHDPLTGLPNRALFEDRLAQALTRAERARSAVAVMLLDLDSFKLVNDTLGHHAGDELLTAVALRLSNVVRPTDTVARLSGDEFAFVIDSSRDDRGLQAVAERILAAFDEPFAIGSSTQRVTAGLGIALGEPPGNPERVLRDADAALYAAKAKQGGFEFFDEGMRNRALRELAIRNALADALQSDELLLYYQPIFSLTSGEVLAVEALLRWLHPQWGWVAPSEFIPLAEADGLIVKLGRYVLTEAVSQAAQWHAQYPGALPLGVFVNVSPRELAEPDFCAKLTEMLRDSGLPPSQLGIEVTERLFIDETDGAVAAVMAELSRTGVQLSLDDFGTGYSALAVLERFPFGVLKMDRRFIRAVRNPTDVTPIGAGIIELGKALGLAVIAEGVENEAQDDYLRRLGCDAVQGFYYARPKPAGEISLYLSTSVDRADTLERPAA